MNTQSNKLDFLIIGAQKSATTTLYKYLSAHPKIIMPASKEAPFFVDDRCNNEEWRRFSNVHFESKCNDELWGKATPQYMADPNAPERIFNLFPNCKLIAILRDPIDRARSHYQMDQRRETEARSFDLAIQATLRAGLLEEARSLPAPTHTFGYRSESEFYVAWSEYGRIIQSYLNFFDRSQLLLLSMSELSHNPEACVSKVLAFLDLDTQYCPPGIGQVAHKGGGKPIVSRYLRQQVSGQPLFRFFWSRVSEQRKSVLRYWFDQYNVKHTQSTAGLAPSTEAALRMHFAKDLRQLVKATGFRPDWLNTYC